MANWAKSRDIAISGPWLLEGHNHNQNAQTKGCAAKLGRKENGNDRKRHRPGALVSPSRPLRRQQALQEDGAGVPSAPAPSRPLRRQAALAADGAAVADGGVDAGGGDAGGKGEAPAPAPSRPLRRPQVLLEDGGAGVSPAPAAASSPAPSRPLRRQVALAADDAAGRGEIPP